MANPESMPEPAFSVLTSELSPAVVVACKRPTLTLFGELDTWGVGGATHLAMVEARGPVVRARRAGETLTLSGAACKEAWMLVWFQGAPGWPWDSPWLVVWQRRPTRVVLRDDGLQAHAGVPLGDVVLLPLFGLVKPKTESWHAQLPVAVVEKCRFWAQALRRYPTACDETFRIDPTQDAVVVRSRFTYRTIDDDWHTTPLPFAPLSPTLAMAHRSNRLPLRLSGTLYDPELCTGFGPYVGIRGATEHELTFALLSYVTQTEQAGTWDHSNPIQRQAATLLENTLEAVFSAPDGRFHPDFGDPAGMQGSGDDGNTCWAMVSHQYYCRALPYLSPALRARAKPRLRRYLADWFLQEKRFKPFRGKLLLVGPGIGTWGGYDDAGKFSSNTLLTLWAYAHFADDGELIRERWPLITRLFVTPRECSWRGFGRSFIAELGDEAAPALAFARLAWGVGDKSAFAYGVYVFARELVHHAVKLTGAAYFAARAPLHTARPIVGPVYLTNLLGDTIGWDMDGPRWKLHDVDLQYVNRWVRFGDPDVARFHRERFPQETRREMDALLAEPEVPPRAPNTVDDPHIRPSRARLRSLLCNDTPEQLAAITPLGAPLSPASAVAAHCLAFLRTSPSPPQTPLIPRSQTATDWEKGIERDCPTDEPVLCVTCTPRERSAPALTWFGWKPPRGGDRWSFGTITTGEPLRAARPQRLSANTVAFHFDPA